MAFLYDVSLNPDSGTLPGIADDMNGLHKELTAILTKISGHPFVTSEGSLFMQVPKSLKKCAKDLKSNYGKVWDDTIIFYEPKAYGASSNKADSYVWFGEFFLCILGGIGLLNKYFGIKLIKAWGIRGSLQARGERQRCTKRNASALH